MSNTAAAIRAAREVQADSRAPELYRQANEWFFRARLEYKLKNFKEALGDALKARRFAEEAEFEALNSGANRVSAPPDPFADQAVMAPVDPSKASAPPGKPPMDDEAPPKKEQKGTYVESYEDQEQYQRSLELKKAGVPPEKAPVVIQEYPSGGTAPTTSNTTPAPVNTPRSSTPQLLTPTLITPSTLH